MDTPVIGQTFIEMFEIKKYLTPVISIVHHVQMIGLEFVVWNI